MGGSDSANLHPQPVIASTDDSKADLDLETMLTTFGSVQVGILVTASLLGAGANLLIIIVLTLTKKLHRLVNAFVFNQAVVDFIICRLNTISDSKDEHI